MSNKKMAEENVDMDILTTVEMWGQTSDVVSMLTLTNMRMIIHTEVYWRSLRCA